jgi:hypothetical protein
MRGRGADRGRLDPFELPRVRSSWAAAGWRWRRSPAQPLPRPPASSWAWPVQAAGSEWRRRPGHASAPVASSRAERRGGTGVHVGRESGQECSRQPGLDSRRPFGACGTGELGRRSDADSDTRRRWVRLRLGTRKTHACKGGGPTPALLGRGPGKIPVFHVERGRLGLPGFPREAEVRELEPQRGALRRRRRRREARARRRAVRARLAGADRRPWAAELAAPEASRGRSAEVRAVSSPAPAATRQGRRRRRANPRKIPSSTWNTDDWAAPDFHSKPTVPGARARAAAARQRSALASSRRPPVGRRSRATRTPWPAELAAPEASRGRSAEARAGTQSTAPPHRVDARGPVAGRNPREIPLFHVEHGRTGPAPDVPRGTGTRRIPGPGRSTWNGAVRSIGQIPAVLGGRTLVEA